MDPGFGWGVVGLTTPSHHRADRTDRNDPATSCLRDHLPRGGLRTEKGSGQVDIHHGLPEVEGHGQELVEGADPGVVDEDVEMAKRVDDLRDHRIDRQLMRDVGFDSNCLPTGSGDRFDHFARILAVVPPEFEFSGVVEIDRHSRPRFGQSQGDSTANPARPPGHERGFSSQIEKHLGRHRLVYPLFNWPACNGFAISRGNRVGLYVEGFGHLSIAHSARRSLLALRLSTFQSL